MKRSDTGMVKKPAIPVTSVPEDNNSISYCYNSWWQLCCNVFPHQANNEDKQDEQ